MNQRFTLDRRSFEQFLAALSLVQQLKRQAAYQRAPNEPNQPFVSLLQLQRAINLGTLDLPLIMSNVVKLTKSVVGANAAGVWLFRHADEFSCCAQIGSIEDPDRLGADILAQLASSSDPASNSCAFSPTLRKTSHYPGSPNSVAIAALRVNEKIVGAVAAFSSDFDAFARRDLDNLHFLADLLERGLNRAMQEGYREAVALEHSALLKALKKIAPHVREVQQRLLLPRQRRASEDIKDSSTSSERAVYCRLPLQGTSSADSFPLAQTYAKSVADTSAADMSVPGIGVRAALGDVREFTGVEKSFFLWEAVRNASARSRTIAAGCRSGAARVIAGTSSRVRNAAVHAARVPRAVAERGFSSSVARLRSVTPSIRNQFAEITHWKLKIRLVGLPRLHPSQWLHFNSHGPGSARSRSSLLLGSFMMKLRTSLNNSKERFSYLLRFAKVQARSFRRDFRQKEANLSAVVAQERMRVRVAHRRQKSMLTNSVELSGEALQHAGESLVDVASSAGRSTITIFSTLTSRVATLRRPQLNPRALRRSASAIGILAIMATFLVLQASVRHSLEHVTASAASVPVSPSVPASLAETSVTPKPGPSSHLEITDASVAETLHDLTRYEIMTLQRAAEYGDDEAAFQLGMAYETGYYVHQNCSKAAHWVTIAAESGNATAAYNLSLRYRNGDGLQVDAAAAEHWLHMASSRSYSPAKLALAAVR